MKACVCTDCGRDWIATARSLMHICNGLRREKLPETEDEQRAVTECACWDEANAELLGLAVRPRPAGNGRRDQQLFVPQWVRNQSYTAIVPHPVLERSLLMTVQLHACSWQIELRGDGPTRWIGGHTELRDAFKQANDLATLWCASVPGKVAQA